VGKGSFSGRFNTGRRTLKGIRKVDNKTNADFFVNGWLGSQNYNDCVNPMEQNSFRRHFFSVLLCILACGFLDMVTVANFYSSINGFFQIGSKLFFHNIF